MTFKVRCPNGHKLRFDPKHTGKEGICPKCQTKVTLKPHPVSDTSILAVLGDAPTDRSVITRPAGPSAAAPAPGRSCPRCRTRVTAAYQLCPSCQTYLPPSCRNDL
ncbi:MAG TPA: hypothetical protein VNH11_05435 [Pirellulales bacterium]|nr:hypothetical protein [Pirellulales bacterium]